METLAKIDISCKTKFLLPELEPIIFAVGVQTLQELHNSAIFSRFTKATGFVGLKVTEKRLVRKDAFSSLTGCRIIIKYDLDYLVG